MNTDIQELAVMGTAEVTAITPKIIANVIQDIAREKVVWAQFYKINTDLMKNGGTEVVFPKRNSGVTASWGIAPGNGLTATAMSFSAVTITAVKAGIGIGIYGEAIRQSNTDVISENLREAGMVWAETMDIAAFEAMFPTATVAVAGNGTFAATSLGIMGIKSVNPSTVTGFTIVNEAGGSSITYASTVPGTVTYWYAPTNSGAVKFSSGASSLVAKDILNTKTGILNYKYHPQVIVVNAERLTDILYDPVAKFLEGSTSRGEGHVYNGQLTNLWGMAVVVNQHMSTFAAVLIDDDYLGYQVVRKELDMQRDQYTGMSMDCLYFWGFSERQFGVVNERAYGAVFVTGTFATSPGLGAGYP